MDFAFSLEEAMVSAEGMMERERVRFERGGGEGYMCRIFSRTRGLIDYLSFRRDFWWQGNGSLCNWVQ